MPRFVRLLAPLLLFLGVVPPASAAVTITFWSHELGNYFPHAFITMRGRPDAGGAPIDMNIGFTARHITPAILFSTVPGMLEPADIGYLKTSDAHFSVVMTDAQYYAVLQLLQEWGSGGDQRYDLGKRNCVTFVKFAAQRLGLAGTDQPGLMKKPRSYLLAVEAANPGRIEKVERHGDVYVAGLVAVPGVAYAKPVLTATGYTTPALAFAGGPPVAAPSAVITAGSMQTGGKGAATAAAAR